MIKYKESKKLSNFKFSEKGLTLLLSKDLSLDNKKRRRRLKRKKIKFLKYLYLDLKRKEQNGEILTIDEENKLLDQNLLLKDHLQELQNTDVTFFEPLTYMLYKDKNIDITSFTDIEKLKELKEAYDYQRTMKKIIFDYYHYLELEKKFSNNTINFTEGRTLYDYRLAKLVYDRIEGLNEESLNIMLSKITEEEYLEYIGSSYPGINYQKK